jgi:cell division initiation protein
MGGAVKIAPIDIAHKTFGRRFMGLDADEVVDFLRVVADEMEALVRERNNLRETLRERDLTIVDFRERDELLKTTITTATRMAEKIREDGERESRLIVGDANQKSELIVRDARDSLKKIYSEITDLKRIRLQFESNLKALIQSHLTMLDQGQKIMPSPDLSLSITREVDQIHEEDLIRSKVHDAVTKGSKSAKSFQ